MSIYRQPSTIPDPIDLACPRLIFTNNRALLTIVDSKAAPRGLTGLYVNFDKAEEKRGEKNPIVGWLCSAPPVGGPDITSSSA